jgi:hypothetical protein
MKKFFWVLSSLALVGMGFVGCDGDDTDACDGKCDDSQICAPIKGAGSECIAASAILDKFKTADGKALKECYVIVKQTNGDLTPEVDSAKCTNYCESDGQCDSNSCNTSTHTCNPKGEAKTEYKYVLINDQSEGTKSRDFGADIDAVVLVKKDNGGTKYAKSVAGFKRGDEIAQNSKDTKGVDKVNAADPEKALGAPDSLINYGGSADTDVCYYYKDGSNSAGNKKCDSDDSTYCGGKEECECDFDYTFVSLGGKGGYIMLEMDGAIEAGDKLDIIELGGECILSNTGGKAGKGTTTIKAAGTETMEIGIAVGSSDLTKFKTIGTGVANKGVYSISISDNMFNN